MNNRFLKGLLFFGMTLSLNQVALATEAEILPEQAKLLWDFKTVGEPGAHENLRTLGKSKIVVKKSILLPANTTVLHFQEHVYAGNRFKDDKQPVCRIFLREAARERRILNKGRIVVLSGETKIDRISSTDLPTDPTEKVIEKIKCSKNTITYADFKKVFGDYLKIEVPAPIESHKIENTNSVKDVDDLDADKLIEKPGENGNSKALRAL